MVPIGIWIFSFGGRVWSFIRGEKTGSNCISHLKVKNRPRTFTQHLLFLIVLEERYL